MWFNFWKKNSPAPAVDMYQRLLVPLGNPGDEYTCTRHNMGRLMLQRWVDKHCSAPSVIHRFSYGSVYSLTDSLAALVPSTYMNLSGRAVKEATKNGYPTEQMIIIHDDKDLPLGTGRLGKSGGAAGHNGLQSIMDELGTDAILRLRLGIGPFQRPLRDWVLEEWTSAEWDTIEKMDAPFADFVSKLANGLSFADLQGRINNSAFWE